MSLFHGVREFFTPHAEDGSFMDKGWINAKEFVEAGDQLVYKCPTWKWSGGEVKKRKSYLPSDKQYLVTRNVPCSHRILDRESVFPEKQDGDWTVFEGDVDSKEPVDIDDVQDANLQVDTNLQVDANFQVNANLREDKEIPLAANDHHMDEEDDEDGFYDTNDDVSVIEKGNIVLTRSYDVYITWDKHYRTPRVWVFGYDEHRNPLTHQQMFEDVSPEHAHKTVSYEYHPHENYMALSIHPCKHASVMKKLIAMWNRKENASGSTNVQLRADQYLFLFLKFIGTIIPTVEYDYSINM